MQRAEVVLGALRRNAEKEGFVFSRVYRYLYNPGMYREGVRARVDELGDQLRAERYYPAGREEDAWVEEAVMCLLEAMFPQERDDADTNRWAQVKASPECRWALRYDIETACDGWHALYRLLGPHLQDGRFWELLHRFHLFQGKDGRVAKMLKRLACGRLQASMQAMHPATRRFIEGHEVLFLGRVESSMNQQRAAIENVAGARGVDVKLEIAADIRRGSVRLGPYAVRAGRRRCFLLIPGDSLRRWRRPFTYRGHPAARNDRLYLTASRIVQIYRQELTAWFQTFREADNLRARLREFHFYHGQSLLKTLAKKDGLSLRQAAAKYRVLQDRDEGRAGLSGGDQHSFYPLQIRQLFSA